MKITFLKKTSDSRRLILFFAGWSSTPNLYSPFAREGWDLAVAHDYTSPLIDKSALSDYHTIYVYAWSLGVFMASRALEPGDCAAAFAICGTECPAHESYGIPPEIYAGTLDSLNPRNLQKFRLRMAGGKERLATLADALGDAPDDIDRLKLELSTIRDMQLSPGGHNHFIWNRAYIPADDRIIPSDAQRRFWKTRPEVPVMEMNGAHFPDFSAIVAATIPDLHRVASRFRNALPTYDDNATAQRIMARHLLSMTIRAGISSGGRILELGQGSGLFTYMYGPQLAPTSISFVDLYPTDRYGAAPEEHYFTADAEQWIENAPAQSFDAILSASCIQWFVNPARFFANAQRVLRPGGILAFSTFAPGNLRELDALRPAPLSYPDPRELELALRRCFGSVDVARQTIPVNFDSKREALRHIKLTGVGGSVPGSSRLLAWLRADNKCTLTFEAFYGIAVKN